MPRPTTITAHKHSDRRANIPTEELRDFVAADEQTPKMLRYPRDPALDPQLVWQGKDAQDGEDLTVPAVPVYIQEKIHPQAIINDLLAQAAKPGSGLREEAALYQLNLFADFNGGPEEFDQKVDFYSHDQNWANRLILGDSLLVMASLAEKEGLRGKVQMIYLDPPYGIKFGSNWQVSTRKRDVKDGKAEDATRQPEQIRAFRDTWKLGIHSYLAYLRDRLVVARELLTETGSIFVQIGDENVHLVRCVMDEVFGSENMVSIIMFQKSGAFTSGYLPTVGDYIIWYGKKKDNLKYRSLFLSRDSNGTWPTSYDYIEKNGFVRRLLRDERLDLRALSTGDRLLQSVALTSSHEYSKGKDSIDFEGIQYLPGSRYWSTSPAGMRRLAAAGRLLAVSDTLRYKMFLDDFPVVPLTNMWSDVMGATDILYVVQTASRVIERCLLMTTDPGDLVLDPTCGSGTTAYVAEQWGRRWITCDTSRVAVALARTRLMSARYPYYLLADSPEGAQKEVEVSAARGFGEAAQAAALMTMGDIRKGFVYRRVPHVTLKAIANNEEIDAIHARWQETLEPLRQHINQVAGKQWQEWEMPRAADGLPPAVADPLVAYWQARRERQAAIDASIARRAETEMLYDQPYEDNKRVRVAGPFTVESLSPHRVLATEAEAGQPGRPAAAGDFTTMILDNLRKAGVQNTRKAERLTFNWLDPYPGKWLHAQGEYTVSQSGEDVGQSSGLARSGQSSENVNQSSGLAKSGQSSENVSQSSGLAKDGQSSGLAHVAHRVAISIGPEHGTVGPQQIKEAAKEAVQGIGFDLLVVCGFAFDPHVSEEVKRYGQLTVLPAKINPDLAMGDELLKKTGAGNLFMVFGEPDVAITPQPDGALVVALNGVDVYDPTTGQIRNASTGDIACWFIDTNYDGESFFVRHAYFTGAEEPYAKLKRALRAEVDESAWAALYRTVSRPFARPASGRIAVKVINHYGDEVLKVYDSKSDF